MRIKEIELSWFRGAGESIRLQTQFKSVVIYGANGSGKSSFADALEYLIADGRIGHLSHEYSGRRQEKGVRNTHTPDEMPSIIKLEFEDGSKVQAIIREDGTFSIQSDPESLIAEIQNWDLERFILRQDELANFICMSKGQKYSVLLPLLGLEHFEHAAENLRQLQMAIEEMSGLAEKRQRQRDIAEEAKDVLEELDIESVMDVLSDLGDTYLDPPVPSTFKGLIEALQQSISERIETAEPEQRRHLLIQQVQQEGLKDKFAKLIQAEEKASMAFDSLLDRRIAVLEPTSTYLDAVEPKEGEIKCPACGQKIDALTFANHVANELSNLQSARAARDQLREARRQLGNAIGTLLENVEKEEVAEWLQAQSQADLLASVDQLRSLDLTDRDGRWPKGTWEVLDTTIPMISARFEEFAGSSPPSTKELIADKRVVDACKNIPEIRELQSAISQIETLLITLDQAETSVRQAIRERTQVIMSSMSADIQRLWGKLHPDEPIEDVQLYMSEDAEKAIDVRLKFYNVAQPSPRLTLSEGHRNSLGLCIFLALALIDGNAGRPIILDDVVSSMDREHRGMLAQVLAEDFGERQVILLTHDREWYTELRWRLPARDWLFLTLRPWEDPHKGIQWSHSAYTFDDARSKIKTDPESAGNRARAIMDTELAIVAEKLQISLPFARGDRNDRRTCIEFLERIISDGKDKLRRKQGGGWSTYEEAISDWETAYTLLGAWANRASHAGSLIAKEAEQLIAACERALERFRCPDCGDPIWIANQQGRKRMQCQCGLLHWRYG